MLFGFVVFFVILLYVLLILQNGISEYFFWNEFVRYNFIAVNYLIYTNEVIENIMESYPVIPVFCLHFLWIHYVFHCPKSKKLY
jgi:hypothetical protein